MGRFKVLHSAAVILAVSSLAYLEINVSFFAEGLHTSLFVLVVIIAALYGDRASGIVAIIAGCIAADYTTKPYGFSASSFINIRFTEFLFIGIVIYVLAWRSRVLKVRNDNLALTSIRLKEKTQTLRVAKAESKVKLAKLQGLNDQLQSLVKQVLDNDTYWNSMRSLMASRVVSQTPRKKG